MTAPQNQTGEAPDPSTVVVVAGNTLSCAVETATDLDHWVNGKNSGDSPDSLTYTWDCGGSGGFITGTNPDGTPILSATVQASSATWQAPDSGGTCSLSCTISDGRATSDDRHDADVVRVVAFQAILAQIWYQNANITNLGPGHLPVIGEGVVVTAKVLPAQFANDATYQWDIGGYAVRDFTADNTFGTVVPLDNTTGLKAASPHFYWVTTGAHRIKVTITVGKVSAVAFAPFFTIGPEVGNGGPPVVDALPGRVSTSTNDFPVGIQQGQTYLHDGYNAGGVQGMEFTALLPSGPQYQGSWKWVQLINSASDTLIEKNGTRWDKVLRNYPVLDTNYPYWSFTNGANITGDSPALLINPVTVGQLLPDEPSQLTLDVTTAHAAASFTDYLMFQPNLGPGADTIAVPLGVFSWSWVGDASGHSDGAGGWVATSSSGANTPAGDIPQALTATTSFPAWSNNVTNGVWITD